MAQPPYTRVSCPLELPIEVEEEILALTARAHPNCAIKLALVSKRVQPLIEAIIYETVVLDMPLETTNRFLRTISSRSAGFFAKNVKKLYLTSIITFSQAERVLSVCTGVTNLTCWMGVPLTSGGLLPLIQTRFLQRLSVKLEGLWTDFSPGASFSRESFSNLSHLDIVNPPDSLTVVDWSWLYDLPALTHISFGDLFVMEHSHIFELLWHLLADCEHLETLVVISPDPSFLREFQRGGTHDPRLVLLPSFHHPKSLVSYWKGIRQGEPDFWALSDGMVERARRARVG